MAARLQLWSYRRFRERTRKNRKGPNGYNKQPGPGRRRRTKHASSNGGVATNESREQTKRHTRCRTVRNTVTNTAAGYTIGTKKPTTTFAGYTIGTKTPNTPTSLTTNETTNATAPTHTATTAKAITTTAGTRHLVYTKKRKLVDRKPQPGRKNLHQRTEQRMA
jgi:hypothetical protein